MEWLSSKHKHLMVVLIAFLQIYGYRACLERERMGLLELKRFVTANHGDPQGLLGSWVDDDDDGKESDCCEWKRVKCNSVTGRVVQLSLSDIRGIEDPFCSDASRWSLNASLFRPFQQLVSLDLSRNCFDGFVGNEGFENLSSLTKLEVLNLHSNAFNATISPSLGTLTSLRALTLRSTNIWEGSSRPIKDLANLRDLQMLDLRGCRSFELDPMQVTDFGRVSALKKLEILMLDDNNLNNSILPYLSKLTSLKNLTLSGNAFSGSFPPSELAYFKDLESLDLSFNSLEGHLNIPGLANMSSLKVLNLEWNRLGGVLPIQGFAVFNKLEVLDLSNNEFTGSIPGFIWNSSSLQILSLRENAFNSSLPSDAFCRMEKLQKLDLYWNRFRGTLPTCMSNLKFLRELDLSFNQFTGNIHSTLISNLTSLEYIVLSYNYFTGLFSFSSFANHRNLEVVVLASNDANFEVETEYTNWVPKFQLKILVLSDCSLNKLTGDVPKFLSHQPYLLQMDLSHNNLNGDLPNWILENKTRLEYLYLRNNSFEGQFPLPSSPNTHLSSVDISKNQLSGQLPQNLGEMLPYLLYLNLAENALEGHIPPSVGNMSSLKLLDLSRNNFSGNLNLSCPSLLALKLSNNRFDGLIFPTQFNLSLEVMLLDNNQFAGTLPDGLSHCSSLAFLDIGHNYFSGEIPKWIYGMINLGAIIMRNNSFHGQISDKFFVKYLDLSYNSLTGSLEHLFLDGPLEHLHLQGNAFTGSVPVPLGVGTILLTLDLGDNNLSGSIPHSITRFSALRILSLKGNNLTGQIPNSICQLSKISILDLSHNSFSGPIPHCFNNMTFGKRGINDLFPFVQDLLLSWHIPGAYYYVVPQVTNNPIIRGSSKDPNPVYFPEDEVEFITKSKNNIYKGDILNFMSGLDLSSNNLNGEIPNELGLLESIHAVNLSHNRLTGSILKDFSELFQLESLDLSFNNLSGEIPSQLTHLNFLSVFIVAHNNFSGRIPDIAQFGTFGERSYEGNPFLCGSMIAKKCQTVVYQQPTVQYDEREGKWLEIDTIVFSTSFVSSYITILLIFFAILYINPYWRRRWFFVIEECIYSCYYFAYDMIYKLSPFSYK